MGNVEMAFLLTGLAGLSTGIGSLIAFFIKGKNIKYLTLAMGFAEGVMIYVSFLEILPKAMNGLEAYYNTVACSVENMITATCGELSEETKRIVKEGYSSVGAWVAISVFFAGMLLVVLIDKWVLSPSSSNKFVDQANKTGENAKMNASKLRRIGILTALALAIHNFPEGVATFVATLEDPTLGLTIAVAIAMHNIPEGIAVSMPIYYATGNRIQAFSYSFLSGLVEPLGAFLGYIFLSPYLTPEIMNILLAGVGGIMVFIALDQLIPGAENYGEYHWRTYGVVVGMAVMAVSLLLLNMGGGSGH